MILKLIEIIEEIKAGYTFRGKLINNPEGKVNIIQLRDIKDNYNRIEETSIKLQKSIFRKEHFLNKGDILFIAKGANNYAITYNGEFENAIASSIFFVMRCNKQKVLPEYLAWFINQSHVQNYLHGNKSGTSTLNISKKIIKEIEVNVPSLEKQKRIAELFKLTLKEQDIISKIKTKRSSLMKSYMLNLLET